MLENNTRLNMVKNHAFDVSTEEVKKIVEKAIRFISRELQTVVINKYQSIKRS